MDTLKELRRRITGPDGHLLDRNAIDVELDRMINERSEEGNGKEFTLYPFGFVTHKEFEKAINDIWEKGYRARVVVYRGVKEP